MELGGRRRLSQCAETARQRRMRMSQRKQKTTTLRRKIIDAHLMYCVLWRLLWTIKSLCMHSILFYGERFITPPQHCIVLPKVRGRS